MNIKHNKHEKPVACSLRKQTHVHKRHIQTRYTIIIDHDDITYGMYHKNIISSRMMSNLVVVLKKHKKNKNTKKEKESRTKK